MSSKLSSLLVQDGVVSVKRMEEAFQRQVIFGGSLDTILLEMNVVDEAALQRFLHASSGLSAADLTAVNYQRAQEQTKLFPQKLAEKYLIAPVDMVDDALRVLVTDPPDRSRLDELGFMLGATIIPLVVPEFRLYQALELIYGVKMPLRYAGLVKRLGDPPQPEEAEGATPGPEAAAATPVEAAPVAAPPAEPEAEPSVDVILGTEEPPDASPVATEEAWDDPYAGAKPDTLVGVPVMAPEHAISQPAQTAAGEIGAPPPAEPPAPEPTPPASGVITGEIEAPAAAPAPSADVKRTVIGVPMRELEGVHLPPEPSVEAVAPVDTAPVAAPPEAAPPEPSVEAVAPVDTAPVAAPPEAAPPEPSVEAVAPVDTAPVAAPPEAAPPEDPAMAPVPAAAPPAEFSAPAPSAAPPMEIAEDQPFDPTPLQFEQAVEALSATESRDDIFALLLRSMAGYFEFAAVFTVFGDQAVGRMAIHRGQADMTRIAQVSIPLTLPSIFRSTVDSKGYYFGPIYDEGLNFGLLAEMERPVPASAFIMPVLIRNRVVCFLYADDSLRPVDPALPESLVFISYQISQSFQRLILRAKREQYSAATQVDDRVGKVDPTDALPRRRSRSSDAWQAAPLTSGPATARAPQQDGALVEQSAPAVQPAFPDLPRTDSANAMSVPGAATPAPEPSVKLTPTEVPPEPEPTPETPAPGTRDGRAITSVGYYSLTDSAIQDEVRGQAGGNDVVGGAAAGELETQAPGTPSAPVAGESPVRVDTPEEDTEIATEPLPRTEDIWSLIDDLERGGEMGDLAGAALQRIGAPALKLLAFRFPGRLSQERMGQAGKLPPPSAHGPLLNFMVRTGAQVVPFLTELLESDNPEVRYYATYIFAELQSPEVLPRLLERVFDSAPPVRRITVEVFKHYQGRNELNVVLEHLRAELVGPVPFRRRCAAEVLGSLRDVAAVPRLIELTADRDAETAESAQRALLLITKQAFGESRRKWKAWWDKNRERNRIQWLIDALGHKESECRFLASQELHQVTGETLGYRFDQERRDREEAIRRWETWWDQRGRSRFESS